MIVWLGYTHTEILSARLLISLNMARYSQMFIFSLVLDSFNPSIIKMY
jgi:hypothetical protein